MLNKNLFFLFILCFTASVNAQDDTQIITESGTPLEDIYIDGVVKRNLINESPVIEYDHVREADAVWERKLWRIIAVREKMNIPFRSPHKPFFNILKDMAENGDVAVFKDEFFREPMTIEEINKTHKVTSEFPDQTAMLRKKLISIYEELTNTSHFWTVDQRADATAKE